MNESLLRWQGRIGSLKGLAYIALIFLVIFLFPTVDNLTTALKNPSTSQSVTVPQLVSGQFSPKQYINVSGVASYRLAYMETEDGDTKAIIYPLIDQRANAVIFVRTTKTELESAPDATATVSGMTAKASTDLQSVIEKDLADINNAGFQTISVLYIEEGQKPGQVSTYLLELAAIGIAGLLSIATLFFPTNAFSRYPVQQIAPGEEVSKAILATGVFQQVKNLQPLEFGKSKRKFSNSNANLFVTDDKTLGIYIHFIFTRRVYGIQVSKQETDWMVLVKPMQVIAMEPGKIYSWRDRWAISVRYRDLSQKDQSLLISFANAASQASFVNFLRENGFAVSSGQYPVSGPVRS
ncbi:MAG TPA: hypothetical protein VF896_10830 [Anaerolineales bacterium]